MNDNTEKVTPREVWEEVIWPFLSALAVTGAVFWCASEVGLFLR